MLFLGCSNSSQEKYDSNSSSQGKSGSHSGGRNSSQEMMPGSHSGSNLDAQDSEESTTS
jgi:hypothetical protein